MNSRRIRYLLIAFVFLSGLWLVWPNSSNRSNQPKNNGKKLEEVGSSVGATQQVQQAPERRDPKHVKNTPARIPTNPKIERILADESISVTDAASMFRSMAADASLPLADRSEALTHGLNLDFTPFANFGETPDLPTQLASEYIDAVINHNESPKIQILAYLALLNHSDPEIVAAAADMLAFAVGDAVNEADPAKLVQMAKIKLAELSQNESADLR